LTVFNPSIDYEVFIMFRSNRLAAVVLGVLMVSSTAFADNSFSRSPGGVVNHNPTPSPFNRVIPRWKINILSAQNELTNFSNCVIDTEYAGSNNADPSEVLVVNCTDVRFWGPVGPPVGPGPYVAPPGLTIATVVMNGANFYNCTVTGLFLNSNGETQTQSLTCEF
jgi:hypothetical protein